jgi:lipopolysaccharide/colanic/teichoic acid biosynthesis glycosyltransferase
MSHFYSKTVKPVLDYVVSASILVLILPLIILISILLIIINSGSPFYIQERAGKDGRVFKLIKFKTMTDEKDDSGNLRPDSCRLTKMGKMLRDTSVDEIPQLLNVIKGEMSLIGPRPLGTDYLPLYNDFQKRRHEVKPGLTGWAQIKGRNALSWDEKFKLDVWYVDNLSFFVDVRIFFVTIEKVLKKEGIGMAGVYVDSVILKDFTGSGNNVDRT